MADSGESLEKTCVHMCLWMDGFFKVIGAKVRWLRHGIWKAERDRFIFSQSLGSPLPDATNLSMQMKPRSRARSNLHAIKNEKKPKEKKRLAKRVTF